MRRTRLFCALGVVATAVLVVSPAAADVFGEGANSFTIEFVTIGDPGNPADTTGQPNPAGSVPYSYRIGKYEISEQMIDKANVEGGLGIMHDGRGPDKPATSVSWFEAARFVNWLNTSTGRPPAYKFDDVGTFSEWEPGDAGYDSTNHYRNRLATYFLPSVDEWYKAAYYDPVAGVYWDYPTGSNSLPQAVISGTSPGTAVYGFERGTFADITLAGGLSPYGTMAQGGNVAEWLETDPSQTNSASSISRVVRGGNSASGPTWMLSSNPSGSDAQFGGPSFRVASVIPEPNTAAMLAIASLIVLRARKRFDAQAANWSDRSS